MESGKRAVTRRSIMHAARKLYEEKGIENTAFSDIADAAGVSRSTVFNYFANSSELLTALCGQELTDLEDIYRASSCHGKDGIVKIFDTLIEDTACYPQLVTQLVYSAVMSGEKNNPLKMIETLIKENLADDKRREQCHTHAPQSADRKVMLLMGAYYGLINHYHLYHKPFHGGEMKREMQEMIHMIIG